MIRFVFLTSACALIVSSSGIGAAAAPPSRDGARAALERACRFFRNDVSGHGGYLYKYSADLKQREGEEIATASMGWVQPPGTPAVGQAYLDAYQLCGEEQLLEAARHTAAALVACQLRSGGWDNFIEFDPAKRRKIAYRTEPERVKTSNTTTLDDNKTQQCLRFLMRLDQELASEDEQLHEAVSYSLNRLLEAQYPNGAWPQRFTAPPIAAEFPVLPASYPDSWERAFPEKKYASYYTLNDQSLADMIDVMLLAGEIYGDARYRDSARRAADFLLLAQMPDPQPAWAQQYDLSMHPAWARKFEPPAVTGGESQSAIRVLTRMARETGETKYVESAERALAYLRGSVLPDGELARFYELQTNRPLYFTRQYVLTYKDDDLPTHYAFKVSNDLNRLSAEIERLQSLPPDRWREVKQPRKVKPSEALTRRAADVIASMDERGGWLEEGTLKANPGREQPILSSRTFIRNVGILSEYIAAGADSDGR